MKSGFFVTAGLIALIALLTNDTVVFAHESITVGDYTLEIGWLDEPPVVGQQNAIIVNVATTANGQPVEDISGLTVAVSYGDQSKTLTLQPLGEDTPGQFVAPVLPTIPGLYTLKLSGRLGSTAVATEVEPEEVQPAAVIQFPSVASGKSTDSDQSPNAGIVSWLVYLSLLIGLIALIIGVMALRKSR